VGWVAQQRMCCPLVEQLYGQHSSVFAQAACEVCVSNLNLPAARTNSCRSHKQQQQGGVRVSHEQTWMYGKEHGVLQQHAKH
jgi:hypothetical protein